MWKRFKKWICLTVLFMFCISSVTYASIDLATFNSKLSTFKKERYAHNSTYQDNPSLTGGYTCFGFANEVALYIWGSYPTKSMSAASVNSGWTVTYGGSAIDNLCVGDIVRYRYHSIFITGISGDTIYYCQANSPSGTNKVTYDNTIARSTLKSRVSEQLTSPNTTKTGWVAHYTMGISPSTPEEPETHKCSYSRGIEAAHPHREYMKCSCGEYYYTGNNDYYTAYEGAHPHRYYYVCAVSGCPYNRTYTGENATHTAYENIYPYKEYYICPFSSCNYNKQFTGKTAMPEKPVLKNMQPVYKSGEEIVFAWNTSETATHYNLYFDVLDGDKYVRTKTIHYAESGAEQTFAPGKYRVLLQATNSNYWEDSTWIYTDGDYVYFTVFDKPEKPVLKNVKDTYNTRDNITFSWDTSKTATHYSIFIDTLIAGEYTRTKTIHYAESGTEQYFAAGKYRVHVTATNSNYWNDDNSTWLYNSSDWVYFSVIDKENTYSSSSVTKNENILTIHTELYNLTVPYEIIIAGYKGSQFVAMKRVPHNEQNSPYTLVGDIDKIKVMVWNGMTPLCDAEEILEDEFISE